MAAIASRWAHQRKVFGKSLLSQPVIRYKMAAMIARVESVQNWLENVTYQMCMVRGFFSVLSRLPPGVLNQGMGTAH